MNRGGFSWRLVSGLVAVALMAPAALAAEAASAPAATAAAAQLSDNEKVLVKARAAYYSLKQEGLAEFTCRLVPNWDKLLVDVRKINAKEADRRLAIFGKIHFEARVAADGKVSVTHRYEGQEPADLAENFRHIYHGVEQTASGFFDSWKGYVLTPYLPQAGAAYTLEQDASQYRVTYKEGGADILILLDPELTIQSARVVEKDFDITFYPQFRKVKGGLLLTGYDTRYEGTSPPTKGEGHILIEYQKVGGFQIPSKLNLTGVDNGARFAVEISFTECRATRH